MPEQVINERHVFSGQALISIPKASEWATNRLGRVVSVSNISYLIQYGRIRKFCPNGSTLVSLHDLEKYYSMYDSKRESSYKARLGSDINWSLSFSNVKESESTKHVHRLHPYKGKFIPQLVEYFIDEHTDDFKKSVYFNKNDIILDPFSGSGTTMVQANECGINAIGIEISSFNSLIANCKVATYDIDELRREIDTITVALKGFITQTRVQEFESKLLTELNMFNSKHFPGPEYKHRILHREIDERLYGQEMETSFLPKYFALLAEYGIKLKQERSNTFLEKWFFKSIRDELDLVFKLIQKPTSIKVRSILSVILSRTMRSCRATTHSDLATLVEPVTTTYYCSKHGKICKPLFSILRWWESYSQDTLQRIAEFNLIRTQTNQYCITGDSRSVSIRHMLNRYCPPLFEKLKEQGVAGVFSSPPYVGMIDYHEQHAYAYDLFGFIRQDDSEIGPLFRGKGKEAQKSYVEGVSQVLLNCKPILNHGYNIFLVANDKYNLYPTIANNAGMQIVNTFRRPVLNRSERDQTAYSETIFHLKEDHAL